ncbi:hypothetical protein N7462_011425 [Penicillium macrosclerotiorum]|uniref:uncharacterized protein n=1 Tax=Penicillium macrosclerotiorum TaxID=303699 RepID=UPI002548CFED|nr:uncharacterized protein N7462_011425 [Penicillium macrosclerotiorum]KAJ5664612.1 hypothetical protein N7462_011425 [Penicillium macrosclerotiorum]
MKKPISTTRTVCLSASGCTIDFLPWELSRSSLLISPILQLLHRHQLAQNLRVELFNGVPDFELRLVAEAITAPSSQWPDNYQRLEFMGDSLLKFFISNHFFHQYPLWHEGYLSRLRDLLVSNERLSIAAVRVQLDRFICTDFISQNHPVFSPATDSVNGKRLSRKCFADIVEALLAAAYEAGGLLVSRKLLGKFLPEISSYTLISQRQPAQGEQFSARLEIKIEQLLGYKFKDRTLIWEALTHPSWQRNKSTSSYQRLEFLGDAILDIIVTKKLYDRRPKLTEGRMTQIRAALVNADFLSFLCMQEFILNGPHCREQTALEELSIFNRPKSHALWMFMRHDSQDILTAQKSCNKRYQIFGDKIKEDLGSGRSYPWAELSRLEASKFYSDLIESIVGAIFIDSRCSLDACGAFLERMNLTLYLERFHEQDVLLEHPVSAFKRKFGACKADLRVSEAKDGLYTASIWLESEIVATVDDCVSRNQAFVRGADAALALLSTDLLPE